MPSPSGPAIAFTNFWGRFDVEHGFLPYLLRKAFGAFHVADRLRDADLILTSVFPHAPSKFPEKTLGVIWENLRPNYDYYARSISSDFDSYGGRNVRAPFWWGEIDWEGKVGPMAGRDFHEPRVALERLMTPRPPRPRPDRFCCFLARNGVAYRQRAVEALEGIGPVDQFGALAGAPIERSKYELLPDYRFNLCFENSTFPGYHTEKPLQAWVGGCVPLYWSDPWWTLDFNPKALINRIDYPSLEAFADRVAEVEGRPELWEEIAAEPLVIEPPSLDGVLQFLRDAVGD